MRRWWGSSIHKTPAQTNPSRGLVNSSEMSSCDVGYAAIEPRGAGMSTRCARALARTAVLTTAVLSAGAVSAPALGGTNASASHVVVLEHKRFLPAAVSIRRGESVTWLWRDRHQLHNVIGRGFQSHTVTHGSFTVRFAHSGTYAYTCTVHPHMDATVIVR
jgi:plastocyanin